MIETDYLPSLITEEKIQTVERGFLEQEQVDCPVVHRFGPGIYIREVHIPAGTMSIGHYQTTEHLNVMLKGKVIMINADGSKITVEAPQTFVSPPGRKVGVILEDMIWQNIYATDETDIEKLEATYLKKSITFNEHLKAQNMLLTYDNSEEHEDYYKAIAEFGFDHKTVREQTEDTSDQIPFPLGGYKVMVANSKIDGKGLFATGNFKEGEVIAPTRIDGKRTPAGRYTNHSKKPNAVMVLKDNGDVDLVATRDISGCKGGQTGEEITVDYRQVLSLSIRRN